MLGVAICKKKYHDLSLLFASLILMGDASEEFLSLYGDGYQELVPLRLLMAVSLV
jgi:hypothetical protein